MHNHQWFFAPACPLSKNGKDVIDYWYPLTLHYNWFLTQLDGISSHRTEPRVRVHAFERKIRSSGKSYLSHSARVWQRHSRISSILDKNKALTYFWTQLVASVLKAVGLLNFKRIWIIREQSIELKMAFLERKEIEIVSNLGLVLVNYNI